MPWSFVHRANGSDIVKHIFTFVADGSGNATVQSGVAVTGEISRIIIIPGSPTPTALYDLTLVDTDTIDVFGGRQVDTVAGIVNTCPGVSLKDGVTTSVVPMVVDSILTLNVAGAGSGGAGKVHVFVR